MNFPISNPFFTFPRSHQQQKLVFLFFFAKPSRFLSFWGLSLTCPFPVCLSSVLLFLSCSPSSVFFTQNPRNLLVPSASLSLSCPCLYFFFVLLFLSSSDVLPPNPSLYQEFYFVTFLAIFHRFFCFYPALIFFVFLRHLLRAFSIFYARFTLSLPSHPGFFHKTHQHYALIGLHLSLIRHVLCPDVAISVFF